MIKEITNDLEIIPEYELTKETVKIMICDDVKRPGVDSLMNWLENESDYFVCPASSRGRHGSRFGGLMLHGLSVFKNLYDLNRRKELGLRRSSMVVMGLFHDICKANSYQWEDKWVKVDGEWKLQKKVVYSGDFPCGHGEKSVIILQKFIPLTDPEIMAIRWHMGWLDQGVHGYPGQHNYNAAKKQYIEIGALMIADIEAAAIDEFDN